MSTQQVDFPARRFEDQYVGPRPRPILSPKEELFAAELWELRQLLTKQNELLEGVIDRLDKIVK